jgi:hypothetical protein
MEPFHRLAAHLGEWPLLLTLAAAQLRELVHLDYLPLDEALTGWTSIRITWIMPNSKSWGCPLAVAWLKVPANG